jgi:hypothetical protein
VKHSDDTISDENHAKIPSKGKKGVGRRNWNFDMRVASPESEKLAHSE